MLHLRGFGPVNGIFTSGYVSFRSRLSEFTAAMGTSNSIVTGLWLWLEAMLADFLFQQVRIQMVCKLLVPHTDKSTLVTFQILTFLALVLVFESISYSWHASHLTVLRSWLIKFSSIAATLGSYGLSFSCCGSWPRQSQTLMSLPSEMQTALEQNRLPSIEV